MIANNVQVIKQISISLKNSRNYKQVQLEQKGIIIKALSKNTNNNPTNAEEFLSDDRRGNLIQGL